MKKERINQEGTISSPVDCANNSNTDQEIEIIEVIDSKTKEKLNVKVLRDPSNYLNPNLNNLTDKDIYSEEKDSKGVPLLNKIELYPNLSEDVYIPLRYICGKVNEFIEPANKYFVNKEGEYIINLDSKFRQNPTNREGKDYERLSINIKDNTYIKTKVISLQRTVSSVFLLNPKPEIYNNVNHINHNTYNNNLSNLEWVTSAKKNSHLIKCLLGEYLSTGNHLWCYLDEEDKIKEDLNYIFYKVDKDGNFIDAGTMSIRSILKVGDGENHNSENEKKYMKARKYINTGVPFEGYYYQQGIDLIKPDPTNTKLIPKRPILKWTPKSKRGDQTNNDTNN